MKLSDKILLTKGVNKMNLQDRGEKTADITVSVDVSKIVRNVSIAGVLVVGIIFGCSTCRKILQDKKD